jgi:hypothetical protein
MLSFSLEDFLIVLENYNTSIWPLQILAYLFGISILFYATKRSISSTKIILAILSLFWLWNGIVFCPIFWAPAYKSAYLFGAFCTVQGLLFVRGIYKSDVSILIRADLYSIVGILFVVYSMIGYQLIGYPLGHVYPKFFPFGLVPCPTTIFTFGLLLMTVDKCPKYYLIVPFILAMGGFLAAFTGILEDVGLILAGFIGTGMLFAREKSIIKVK